MYVIFDIIIRRSDSGFPWALFIIHNAAMQYVMLQPCVDYCQFIANIKNFNHISLMIGKSSYKVLQL